MQQDFLWRRENPDLKSLSLNMTCSFSFWRRRKIRMNWEIHNSLAVRNMEDELCSWTWWRPMQTQSFKTCSKDSVMLSCLYVCFVCLLNVLPTNLIQVALPLKHRRETWARHFVFENYSIKNLSENVHVSTLISSCGRRLTGRCSSLC